MKAKILVLLVSVALLVGILSGCTETTEEENKLPEAIFSYDPMTGIYVGTEIQFNDESTDEDGTIASWSWDFGDDVTSIEQDPIHNYSAVGTYTVTLIVTDNDGNVSSPETMDIEVTYVPPTAYFTYDPMVNISVNETITFTDNSTIGDANITSSYWNFGDGTNSTEHNPEHMFETAGTYTVALTVTDENDMTDTFEVTIEVTES